MDNLVIRSNNDVRVTDNVLLINTGYGSDTFMPIPSIRFVSEIHRHRHRDSVTEMVHAWFSINDDFQIQTVDVPLGEYDNTKTIIYAIHNMILAAVKEYYNNSIKIDKPREIQIKQE